MVRKDDLEKIKRSKEQREITFNGMTATEWALNSRSVWKDIPSEREDARLPGINILPIELLDRIISMYSKEGDVVFDPFMGSGTTGIACIRKNRKFIGIEKNPEFFEMAVNRIKTEINNKF